MKGKATRPSIVRRLPSFTSVLVLLAAGAAAPARSAQAQDTGPRAARLPGSWVVNVTPAPEQDGATFLTKVRGTMSLSDSGQTFSGSFRTDVLLLDGTVVFSFDGTVEATRFGVEPL